MSFENYSRKLVWKTLEPQRQAVRAINFLRTAAGKNTAG